MPKRTLILMKVIREADAPVSLLRGDNYRDDIRAALNPELVVERYGRVWRLSAPEVIDQRWMWGKLGFQTSDDAVEYDEERHDFVNLGETRARASYAHYVLDLESQLLLFEMRPPDIKMGSFRGALNAILRETESEYHFTAEVVTDENTLARWLRQVDVVSVFKVSLRRPNPVWDGRYEELRNFLEGSNSARATVEAVAPEDESLNVAGSQLSLYADYAAEGYGRVRAKGLSGGRTVDFDSEAFPRRTTIEAPKDAPSEKLVRQMIERIKDFLL